MYMYYRYIYVLTPDLSPDSVQTVRAHCVVVFFSFNNALVHACTCCTFIFCIRHRRPSREGLQLAMRNVEQFYTVVGLVEYFPQFLKLLETTMPQFFRNISYVYGGS